MKYTVKQYWNGVHWDNSYTDDRAEAEYWARHMNDKNTSIRNRVNWDALEQFIEEYNIEDEENIEVVAEIVEEMYERIKNMTKEQMQDFIYWVYMNGNADGKDNLCDTYGNSYFGGAMLNMSADDVMPKVYELYA